MKKILILGANGQIARFAIPLFLKEKDVQLTLYARDITRLKDLHLDSTRASLVEGDVLKLAELQKAVADHDVVYANLDGELVQQAKNIVAAMGSNSVKRLIFISSMGIYDEVPGQKYKSILNPYRDSAAVIEESNLDYTIIRPEWLNNNNEVDYELTRKGELFKNPQAWLSRKSVADLVVKLSMNASMEVKQSLGINKP